MRRGQPPRRPGGFTLLEVLVTVTIFALLFAVLMGGWFQAMNAQSRMGDAARQIREQQQLSLSLRQLVADVLSPAADRGTVFTGSRRGFVAETSSSLAPGMGAAPLATSVQIEAKGEHLQLRIESPGKAGAVYPWVLDVAELRYYDRNGQAHDNWPEASYGPDGMAGKAANLPSLVQLTVQFEGQAQPMSMLIAPRASAWQLPEPRSPFLPNG